MKKSITLMLLLMMTGSASADLVLKTEGRLSVVPKVLTTSGKSVFYSYDSYEPQEVTVYSPDNFEPKTFNLITTEYQSGEYTEEATVTVTGVNVVLSGGTYYKSSQFEADSQEAMINNLNSYWTTYTAFTDPLGNPACYSESGSFFCESLFGKKYPTQWYALIEGMVYGIYTYSGFYTPVYNEESAVWTKTSENMQTYTGSVRSITLFLDGVWNYTKSDSYPVYIAQCLFNDDDKWEYLVPEYGPQVVSYNSYDIATVNGDGTVTLRRRASVRQNRIGYAVYNEDGTRLYRVNDTSGEGGLKCFLGGEKVYFQASEDGYNCLYELNKEDGNIDLVEVVRAKSDRRLETKRGIVTVDIDAEQAGGEVVISTTDGKVLANKKVGVGQTQVNDQPLPAGIYVVSLFKDGKVVESEKYLVQ